MSNLSRARFVQTRSRLAHAIVVAVWCLLLHACSEESGAGVTLPTQPTQATDATSFADVGVPTEQTDTKTSSDTTTVMDTALTPDDTALATDAVETTPTVDTTKADTTPPVDTTPPPDPEIVRFVVMGDAGTGSATQHQVADTIKTKCDAAGCDFVILCGDNIYDTGVESVMDTQWEDKFEAPYEDLDMPFYAVLGNHDNGGFLSIVFGDALGGAGGEFIRGDIQVSYTNVSDKWRMPARFYDFVEGPAHFFGLDTNDMLWSAIDASAMTRSEAQYGTVPSKIAASDRPWRFAMGHHPYVSNGQHGNAGSYDGLEEEIDAILDALSLDSLLAPVRQMAAGVNVKAGLEEVVCDTGIDIYFSGHDHNRQWIEGTGDCAGTTFVVSGAGAKVKDFARSDSTPLFADADTEGFFWFEVIDNTLNVEAIDKDGTVQWTHTVTK